MVYCSERSTSSGRYNMQNTNENKRQENLLKIEQNLHKYLRQYNNNFDTVAYTKNALEHLKTNASLDSLDASNFINKDNNNNDKNDKSDNMYNNNIRLIEDDGKFVAVGPDGTIIDGKSFEETNDKVCQLLAQRSKAEGKEPIIYYHSKDPDKLKIFSKNAIMKFGITIRDGYSDDPKFWQSLKNEYLNDEKHSLQDWERMTRLIPDSVMQRTDEEKKRNQQLIKELANKKTNNDRSNFLKQLRNGHNPNLPPLVSQQKINQHPKAPIEKTKLDLAAIRNSQATRA